MITYIVVDTGYLLEWFKIPAHSDELSKNEIESRFEDVKKKFKETAGKQDKKLYIPIPVLFELANHIAHVKDGNKRYDLTVRFTKTVNDGINPESTYLNIIPCESFSVASELSNNLEKFVQQFADEFVKYGLGFTDSSVLLEARKLKTDYNIVHIWTTDEQLKNLEPNRENPSTSFIGSRKT